MSMRMSECRNIDRMTLFRHHTAGRLIPSFFIFKSRAVCFFLRTVAAPLLLATSSWFSLARPEYDCARHLAGCHSWKSRRMPDATVASPESRRCHNKSRGDARAPLAGRDGPPPHRLNSSKNIRNPCTEPISLAMTLNS